MRAPIAIDAGVACDTDLALRIRRVAPLVRAVAKKSSHAPDRRLLTGRMAVNISALPPAAGPELARLCGLVFPDKQWGRPAWPVRLLRPRE